MHHLVSIEQVSWIYRRFALGGLLLGLMVCHGCKSGVQNVSTDIGGGRFKGDPPMCYQYRGEASPTTYAANILVHINNTCSYAVDCMIYDDVTEQKHAVSQQPFISQTILLAPNVKASRVDLKLECTWKP